MFYTIFCFSLPRWFSVGRLLALSSLAGSAALGELDGSWLERVAADGGPGPGRVGHVWHVSGKTLKMTNALDVSAANEPTNQPKPCCRLFVLENELEYQVPGITFWHVSGDSKNALRSWCRQLPLFHPLFLPK